MGILVLQPGTEPQPQQRKHCVQLDHQRIPIEVLFFKVSFYIIFLAIQKTLVKRVDTATKKLSVLVLSVKV